MRRQICTNSLLATSAILCALVSCSERSATLTSETITPPNIIFIYADDLGYGEIEPYGQTKIKTPNLKRMGEEGMRFTNFYTSTPVCAPARCALLTGLHTGHTWIRGNRELGQFHDSEERGQEPLPAGTVTIGTLLKSTGYKTGAVGKWGLGMTGNSGHPNEQGFDYFYGYLDQKQAHNYYPTHLWENDKWDSLDSPYIYVHNLRSSGGDVNNRAAIEAFGNRDLKAGDKGFFEAYKGNEYAIDRMTGKAQRFIAENKDNTFFLYLAYTIPHVSLQVPDSALRQYVGKWEEQPYYGEQGYSPHPTPKSAYAAMITYLDSEVGKILALVDSLGLDDNTIIFFSSDNGPTFTGGVDPAVFNSAGGLRGLKMDLYEGGIRVPMIARWPGKISAGSTTGHVSAQYDVMATIADLVGIQPPENTDGISFLPVLLGNKDQQQHEFLYFEYPEKRGQVAVRYGKWKGVKTDLVPNPANPWQLFDLDADPSESKDLAKDHPDVLAKLDEIVRREHRSTHVAQWNFMDTVLTKSPR